MSKRIDVVKELKIIADKHRGILRAEDVVEAAKPKTHPLHHKFVWDDTKAAYEYRLWQARQLIRVSVEYLERPGGNQQIKAFVSLTPDRENDGGGYRHLIKVLSSADYRVQLLEDALAEMEVFKKKYSELSELAAVFGAMDKVKGRKKVRRVA